MGRVIINMPILEKATILLFRYSSSINYKRYETISPYEKTETFLPNLNWE